MASPPARTASFIAALLGSCAGALFVSLAAASIVSGLPRLSQGEAVIASWTACVVTSVCAAVLLPWLVSLAIARNPRQSMTIFALLSAGVLLWYFVGFEQLLTKAYQRGL